MLNETRAEPLESWCYHGKAGLALLPIHTIDTNFEATLIVWAEQEALALIPTHHVGQASCKDVVAPVLAFLLARRWVLISDRKILL